MNIIKQFEDLITQWNEDEKCGYCWKFIGAGRPDLFNQFNDFEQLQCCIYVGIFNIKFGTKYKADGQFMVKDYCYISFEGFIGIPSRLDIQFYNELGNTELEKEESKWNILNTIKDCLGCEFLDLICDDEEFYSPSEFNAEQKINYQNANYDGWWITGRYIY